MLSASRIKCILGEVAQLQKQQKYAKNCILKLLSDIYPNFKSKSYKNNILSADYVYTYDDSEVYRPDYAVYILLETETRYIQFSIKCTHVHSDINTRIWITINKDINPDGIALDYSCHGKENGFIEVQNDKDAATKYNLTKFEQYIIRLVTDSEMNSYDLNPAIYMPELKPTTPDLALDLTLDESIADSTADSSEESTDSIDSEKLLADYDSPELNNICPLYE